MPLVTANVSVLAWMAVAEGPGWLMEVTANPAGEGRRMWFLNDFQYRCSAECGDGPVGALTGLKGAIGLAMVVLAKTDKAVKWMR